MNIITLTVGELGANCYLLVFPDQHCLIIDPGDEADYISTTILENHLIPTAILLTHGHYDHVLAVPELVLNFSLPVYLHPKDIFLYQKAFDSASHWSSSKPVTLPLPATQDITKVSDDQITVIHTPGHTPGSVSILVTNRCGQNCAQIPPPHGPGMRAQLLATSLVMFTGDTLFADGVGNTSHRYSSPTDLKKSLSILSQLPPSTLCYPGHSESEILSQCTFFNL